MQILSNPIYALNVRESPKFSPLSENRDRGTRWRRQILDRKWKYMYGRFVHPAKMIGTVRLLWTWL